MYVTMLPPLLPQCQQPSSSPHYLPLIWLLLQPLPPLLLSPPWSLPLLQVWVLLTVPPLTGSHNVVEPAMNVNKGERGFFFFFLKINLYPGVTGPGPRPDTIQNTVFRESYKGAPAHEDEVGEYREWSLAVSANSYICIVIVMAPKGSLGKPLT